VTCSISGVVGVAGSVVTIRSSLLKKSASRFDFHPSADCVLQ
jgi:hypothetical protein